MARKGKTEPQVGWKDFLRTINPDHSLTEKLYIGKHLKTGVLCYVVTEGKTIRSTPVQGDIVWAPEQGLPDPASELARGTNYQVFVLDGEDQVQAYHDPGPRYVSDPFFVVKEAWGLVAAFPLAANIKKLWAKKLQQTIKGPTYSKKALDSCLRLMKEFSDTEVPTVNLNIFDHPTFPGYALFEAVVTETDEAAQIILPSEIFYSGPATADTFPVRQFSTVVMGSDSVRFHPADPSDEDADAWWVRGDLYDLLITVVRDPDLKRLEPLQPIPPDILPLLQGAKDLVEEKKRAGSKKKKKKKKAPKKPAPRKPAPEIVHTPPPTIPEPPPVLELPELEEAPKDLPGTPAEDVVEVVEVPGMRRIQRVG